MNEMLHADCARMACLLPAFVDGDLTADELAQVDRHLSSCDDCRASLERLRAVDTALAGWATALDRREPPPADAREQLAARMAPRPAFWLPAAAAVAVAVALALILVVPRPEPRDATRQAATFVEIPGLPPLDPHENATIVRMNIQVSTLIAIGYRVADDPEKTVPAEVLVGEDGRAHAVRVLADLNWNGTGD